MTSFAKQARYLSGLAIFPLLEFISFCMGIACWESHPGVAVLLWGLASLSLCFSVHVTFHEAVHQNWFGRGTLSSILDAVMTLFMGLPMEGYRWHHLNHHRFNNTLEDYSSTWIQTSEGIRPQALWAYAFGWPVQLRRAQMRMNVEESEGTLPAILSKKMVIEKWLMAAFLAALTAYQWKVTMGYLAYVYVGWVFVALENYAQHPPRQYGADTTTSYYDDVYNWIFSKNGLHAEHHRTAALPWIELRRISAPRQIRYPYLIDSILSKKRKEALR